MNNQPEAYLLPDWPAPDNIVALTSLRAGGVSKPPYDSWNLADHVGDERSAVSKNRLRLAEFLPTSASMYWMQQVHGDAVQSPAIAEQQEVPIGDAWFCQQPEKACCILTADCLPILICDKRGQQVAAVHAGWRGVANRLLFKVMQLFHSPADQLLVWIGPGISLPYFRVGNNVRDTLLSTLRAPFPEASLADDEDGFSYVDLASIARTQCQEFGVAGVYGGEYCSFSDAQRYFSFRRDGVTGRNVSLILRLE
ncbi:MAG: peptidoglycan editing factor PgeF [Pseudomonadota bacterium]